MPDPTGRISHLPDMHRGVAWKEPVRCATTASITITSGLNAGDVIDGVTLADGDRVLVKDQGTPSQNGIYIAGTTPVRAFDMDQDTTTSVPASEVLGAHVYVIEGTANGGTRWYVSDTAVPDIGTDAINWTEWTYTVITDHGGLTGLTDDDHTQYVENADDLAVAIVIDGGGSAITTGVKCDVPLPFTGHIRGWTLVADQSGSIVIDLWLDDFAAFPPTDADSITAANEPELSSAASATDSTLTGWTTAFTAGDVLRLNVDSATTVERVTLSLTVDRT